MRSSRVGKGRRDPRVNLAESNRFSPVHSRVPPPGGHRLTDGHARPSIPENAKSHVSGWQDVRYRTDPSIQTRSTRIGSVRGAGGVEGTAEATPRRRVRGSAATALFAPGRDATAGKREGRLGCPGRPSDDLLRGSGALPGVARRDGTEGGEAGLGRRKARDFAQISPIAWRLRPAVVALGMVHRARTETGDDAFEAGAVRVEATAARGRERRGAGEVFAGGQRREREQKHGTFAPGHDGGRARRRLGESVE